MSGHLIGCVKSVTTVGKSQKLALVAFADSADDRTHIGFPGYEGVQAWAGCSRSRAAELIADLVEAGLLRLHKSARPGRRAEYIVFPDGCCELHRPASDDRDHTPSAVSIILAMQAAGVPLTPEQRLVLDTTSALANGSEVSDPSSVNGSEISDPFGNGSGNGSEISDPLAERVQNASEISDPFTTTTTSPPSPRKRGAIDCPKHRDTPGDNCRVCGTTPRQIAEQERRDAAERRRTADRLAAQADRERRLTVAVPLSADLKASTRAQIHASKPTARSSRRIS